ncbi:hypothetical protein B0H66DRAFT_539320 [Apodospora peruviana]|uniref:Poly [ADP-ribose] polymerase n=1 Tax=Apodospora peruviana TaxID=516989 RepID=A0AAE0IPP5_9PEZI|nr:hypothetical protein B0H66DRAFT_539320 [Apodospora peruviana]
MVFGWLRELSCFPARGQHFDWKTCTVYTCPCCAKTCLDCCDPSRTKTRRTQYSQASPRRAQNYYPPPPPQVYLPLNQPSPPYRPRGATRHDYYPVRTIIPKKPKAMDLPMRKLNPHDRDYKFYAQRFNESWLHPGKTAEIRHIYLASRTDLMQSSRAQRFAEALTKSDGSFVTRFHGSQRACYLGEGGGGDIDPCGKSKCHICGILKNGFDRRLAKNTGMFGPGIYSTECSSKADIYAKNSHIRTTRHVILICRVVGDRPQMLVSAETNRQSPDARYNCVEAVLNVAGGRVVYPETVVYDEDQILPVGLVVYKRTRWSP